MKTIAAMKPSRRRLSQIAGDAAVLKAAVRLDQDAGFEPVVVRGLARAKDFDVGAPGCGKPMTTADVRRTLGIRS